MKLALVIVAVCAVYFCDSKKSSNSDEDLGSVPICEMQMAILKMRLKKAKDEATRQKLLREIDELLNLRDRVEKTMRDIVRLSTDDIAQFERIYTEGQRDIDFDCYDPAVDLFNKRCYNVVNTYSASGQLKYLVNTCAEKIPSERILDAIGRVCRNDK